MSKSYKNRRRYDDSSTSDTSSPRRPKDNISRGQQHLSRFIDEELAEAEKTRLGGRVVIDTPHLEWR